MMRSRLTDVWAIITLLFFVLFMFLTQGLVNSFHPSPLYCVCPPGCRLVSQKLPRATNPHLVRFPTRPAKVICVSLVCGGETNTCMDMPGLEYLGRLFWLDRGSGYQPKVESVGHEGTSNVGIRPPMVCLNSKCVFVPCSLTLFIYSLINLPAGPPPRLSTPCAHSKISPTSVIKT